MWGENKNLMRRQPTGGILPGGEDEYILGLWETPSCKEAPVIPYIKETKKNSFYNLEN